MKRLLSITVLLVVFVACQKKIADEVLQSKSSELSKVAASQAAYRIPSQWTFLPVPATTGSDPASPSMVMQVDGQVFCVISPYNWYKLNNTTTQWVPIDDILLTVETQYFFSYKSKFYCGMSIGPDSISRNFFSRDINTNETTGLAPFPGTPVTGATFFIIGDKGYIVSGKDRQTGNLVNQFWEYNISTNQWTNKKISPVGARGNATAMVVDDKAYIGLGYNHYTLNGQRITQYNNDWIVYYPASGISNTMASFPGQKRSNAKGFVLNKNPYVGFGANGSSYFKDLWKYDVLSNAWMQQQNFPGGAITSSSRISTFSWGKSGYVVKGALAEFWRFSINR